jgi:hypothetical protein
MCHFGACSIYNALMALELFQKLSNHPCHTHAAPSYETHRRVSGCQYRKCVLLMPRKEAWYRGSFALSRLRHTHDTSFSEEMRRSPYKRHLLALLSKGPGFAAGTVVRSQRRQSFQRNAEPHLGEASARPAPRLRMQRWCSSRPETQSRGTRHPPTCGEEPMLW